MLSSLWKKSWHGAKNVAGPGFLGLEFFSSNHVQIKNQVYQHEGHIMSVISTPFFIVKSMQPFRICTVWLLHTAYLHVCY